MDQTYMKKENVLKLLITMALPMVISMLVNSLYNIVDSFFVAQISEDAMTAISLVFPMQNFINSVMIGFGIGINSVISFYMGAQKNSSEDQNFDENAYMIESPIHYVTLDKYNIGKFEVTQAQWKAAMGNNPSTIQKGSYGFVEGSKVFFNTQTQRIVVLDKSGNFVTGFKLLPNTPQYANYMKNGVLR